MNASNRDAMSGTTAPIRSGAASWEMLSRPNGRPTEAAPQRASFSAPRRSCSPGGADCPSIAPEAAEPLPGVHGARRRSRSHRRRRTAGLLPARSNLIDLVQRTRFENRSDEAGLVVPGPHVKRGWDPSSIERSGSLSPTVASRVKSREDCCELLACVHEPVPVHPTSWRKPPVRHLEHEWPIPGP
jgi:hypothetical protein